MDLLNPAQFAQFVVAASVSYAMYITFFKPKAGTRLRARQSAAVKQIVKQRSERWAA